MEASSSSEDESNTWATYKNISDIPATNENISTDYENECSTTSTISSADYHAQIENENDEIDVEPYVSVY